EFAQVEGDPAELMRICVENGMFTYSFLKEASSKVCRLLFYLRFPRLTQYSSVDGLTNCFSLHGLPVKTQTCSLRAQVLWVVSILQRRWEYLTSGHSLCLGLGLGPTLMHLQFQTARRVALTTTSPTSCSTMSFGKQRPDKSIA